MQIQDRVFGKVEINDPIFVEVIESRPFQRLKKLWQYGLPSEYYHKDGFTRFEHSMGVFLLLQKLGASREEQMAGLLHDISHTAFSHIIDWVYENWNKEDWQDTNHLKYVSGNGDLVQILEKGGFDVDSICDLEKFSLLENPAPHLCADRVEYALRELSFEVSGPKRIERYLDCLEVRKGEIVFSDRNAAREFALDYLGLQESHWGGFEAVSRYIKMAEIIRKALRIGIISEEDFYLTDQEVIDKIYAGGNKELSESLTELRSKQSSLIGKIQKKKFRYVDPGVVIDSGVVALSEIDLEFKKLLAEAETRNNQGVRI